METLFLNKQKHIAVLECETWSFWAKSFYQRQIRSSKFRLWKTSEWGTASHNSPV